MQTNHLSDDAKITRFSPFRIIEHQANMIAFALLVLTGLSQKFHEYSLSQWVIITLGGIDAVRLLHRYTGVFFGALVALHIAVAVFGVLALRWPASIVINRKDFRDAIENLRYYFGVTDQPARCDRYDYKQKFEYWGVVVGGILMIATGLVLWFPTAVVRWLPGEFVPAAKAAHTNEALLAFLVIIIWHLYNAIFSPEVFPLDTSIFTGRISVKRMKHEHPIELERITGEPAEGRRAAASAAGDREPKGE
ncbi:MAG: cytochrome b/b6 domain-containing protein [Thermodesulfovibrionales bacterium]